MDIVEGDKVMENVAEVWRPVPISLYSDLYEVSNIGRVRRLAPARGQKAGDLVGWIKKCGNKRKAVARLTDSVTKQDVSIARMVYESFKNGGKRLPEDIVIMHDNGDMLDNYIGNLSLSNRSDTGKRYGCESRRRPVAKIDPEGNVLAFYPSCTAAAKANFTVRSAVGRHCDNKVKKRFVNGYSFRWDD